jgi:hypothetical protein
MVVATKDLDVICYGKSSSQADLPSCVPDWGNELPQTLVMDNQGDNLYDATGSLKGRLYRRSLAITEFVKNGLVLKVKGFPFDMIEGLGLVLSRPAFKRTLTIQIIDSSSQKRSPVHIFLKEESCMQSGTV